MNISDAAKMLPGSEVAQIVTDARQGGNCPWENTGDTADEARRQLWEQACADARKAADWRGEEAG